MKHRTSALLLALALSLSLLAGCGPKDPAASGSASQGSASSGTGGDLSQPDASQPDGSVPDVSTPDASVPDASIPDGSAPDVSTPEAPKPDVSKPEAPKPAALNRSDFSLFKAGATFKLAPENVQGKYEITYASGNEKVATVDKNGLVTAVAPGTAQITAKLTVGKETQTLNCAVRCKFKADVPASKPEGGDSSSSGSAVVPGKVDLAAFYADTSSKYELPGFLQQADQTILDNFYPGLSAIATEQSIVNVCMMSLNNGENALIQVKDKKDIDGVKAILQARIDTMINGGAWYPGPTEIWTNSSRVVSNGNYIMMIVSEDCEAIVADFNALFQ